MEGSEGSEGSLYRFCQRCTFDDCESYGRYKQGMRLRVYRDVVM